ncbi:MAG: LysR family transcriptional regulator, partial [Eubacterium sp.]|nr:LysR family transcriptional regulator [Eubacterium sp.]
MSLFNTQLETFLITADCGSFRKAGDEMFISATAVQKQITLLEQNLGVKLFVRTNRGLTLSPAGKSLYADGKYLLQFSKEAETRVRTASETMTPEIRVVFSPISPPVMLSKLWPEVMKIDPNFNMILISRGDDPKTKAETLQNMGITIDLIESAYDEDKSREAGLRNVKLCDIPLGIVLRRDHPLAERKHLTIRDLEETKLIIPIRGVNQYADNVRNELIERQTISILEIDDYTVDTYNLCLRENCAMLALNPTNVHPLLIYRKVDWPFTIPYGLLCSAEPS